VLKFKKNNSGAKRLINAKLKTGKKGHETEAIGGNAAKVNSHLARRSPAVLCRGLEKSPAERHGHGTASVNQTRPHCVNQMGKIHSKPLAARHGHGMLCVKDP
jgi:hypothetical protein